MITLRHRIIRLNKRKTSVRLSSFEWQAFDFICAREQISSTAILNFLAQTLSQKQNLTASIRIFTLCYYVDLAKTLPKSTGTAPNLNKVLDIIALMK